MRGLLTAAFGARLPAGLVLLAVGVALVAPSWACLLLAALFAVLTVALLRVAPAAGR